MAKYRDTYLRVFVYEYYQFSWLKINKTCILGIAQTIQVRLEEVEGGVVDMNELEARDISAQYSINFISITPYSYCQKKMIIKNLT